MTLYELASRPYPPSRYTTPGSAAAFGQRRIRGHDTHSLNNPNVSYITPASRACGPAPAWRSGSSGGAQQRNMYPVPNTLDKAADASARRAGYPLGAIPREGFANG